MSQFGLRARIVLAAFGVAALGFLVAPLLIVVPMSFSAAKALAFPPVEFSLRWYRALLFDDAWRDALGTSLLLGTMSSTIAIMVGGLAAYGFSRAPTGRRASSEMHISAPLIVPAIIAAVALYMAWARVGLLGTFAGLVIAHVILCAPVVVIILVNGFNAFDQQLEQVAWSLGAGRVETFIRIVLPNLLPSFAAAWLFGFLTSFDEVVVTSFIAGSYQTIPKKMFAELVLEVNPTITAVASLLVAATVLALALTGLMLRKKGSVVATVPDATTNMTR